MENLATQLPPTEDRSSALALAPGWASGNVRLYLGDCREIMPTLTDIDVVITDPPYGLNFPYRSYDDTRENLVNLLADVMPEISRIAANAYILCGPTQIGLYPQPEWVCAVTWNTTGTFGKYGYNQWTPVLCYGKDLEGFGNVNGMTKGDTLRINGGSGVGFQRDDAEKEHTCPKPLNLMKMVVNRYSKPGQIVCDPFMGSGTTGVACAALGRGFVGIEQDSAYYATALERIQRELSQGDLFLPPNA